MEYLGKHRKEMISDLKIKARQVYEVAEEAEQLAEQLINADLSIEIDKELRLDDQTRAAMNHNLVVFAEAMIGFSLSYHVPLRLDSPLLIWDESGRPLEAKHIDIYVVPDENGDAKGFLIDFSSDNFEGLTGDSDKDTHLNTLLRQSLTIHAKLDSSQENNEGSYEVFSSGIIPYDTAKSIPFKEISDGYLSVLYEIMDEDFKQLTEYGYSYGDEWIHVHNEELSAMGQWARSH